ncbi:MAG: type 4a pilus biogenesis protein PilO [Bacteriovorax sp.]|nr:type 4a pilus biogenesis protein PilO [Bacteriovorax sp.]
MEKLLRNIHWIIIAGALFNIGMYYKEVDDKISEIIGQQEIHRQALQKARKTKKDISAFYKDIDEAKGRIERVAREIERTQQLLPSEVSDTENISLLRRMAEDVNIKELSIMPDKDDDRGFYIARKYKFRAKATYLQFLIMFEKISENKRILNVSELSFKKLEQPQRSKFQLIDGEFTLEAYHYNAAFKEDRGIDTIEKEFKRDQPTAANAAKKPKTHTKKEKAEE